MKRRSAVPALSTLPHLIIAIVVMMLVPAIFARPTQAAAPAHAALPNRAATLDAASCFEFEFAPPSRMRVGSNVVSIKLADFNEDGVKDFVVTEPTAGLIWIAAGLPDGTFGVPVSYAQPDVWWVAIGDFNRDGHLDIAVPNRTFPANSKTGAVSILLGTGTGSFTALNRMSINANVLTLRTGDFNRDGVLDLVLVKANNTVEILIGAGDGTFQTGTNYAVGKTPYDAAVGDFNGDGRQDLAVPNMNSGNLSVLIATGDGTFDPAVNLAVGGQPVNAEVGDLNADGHEDVVVAKYGGDTLSVLLGIGDGKFGAAVPYQVGMDTREVAIGDIDGDGREDIAAANYQSNYISILTGKGDGTFAAKADFDVGVHEGSPSIVIHDFDGDGRQDVAVTSSPSPDGNYTVSIMRNLCGPVITGINPTMGPTGGGDTVRISGRHLEEATSVLFGGSSATIALRSISGITVTTAGRSAPETVNVAVTTEAGTSIKPDAYTFDYPPMMDDQMFWVREHSAIGSVVGSIVAFDRDPSPTFTFSIEGGTDYGIFGIDARSGIISVGSKLDYERVTSYWFLVTVSDGWMSNEAGITINVVDVPEPPTLTAITPAFGPASGGSASTITGNYLADVTAVTFGGSPAILGARTNHSIALTTAAHSPGPVDVVVTTPSGSATLTGAYSYTDKAPKACLDLRKSAVHSIVGANSIAVADFNGDGRQDVAIATTTGHVRAMLADAGGYLTTSWSRVFDSGAVSVVAADLNDDGKQDLVFTAGWTWGVYLGDGTGSFVASGPRSSPGGVTLAGDFDGDGDTDVAFYSPYWYDLFLFPGVGNGTFGGVRGNNGDYDIPGYTAGAVGDFNADGHMDVAMTGWELPFIDTWRGTDYWFDLADRVTVESPRSVVTGDFNGDGRPDLAATNAVTPGVSVLLGSGVGSFESARMSATALSPTALTVGDFNNDGFQDLALAYDASNDISILAGDGTGNLTAAGTLSAGTAPAAIAAGDFNGDGRHDLVVLSQSSGTMSVFISSCGASLITAVAPAIGSTKGGQTVTISGSAIGGATTVTFGGEPATILTNSETEIKAVTPSHTAGKVDVVVTMPNATVTAAGAYTFDAPPVVNASTFSVAPVPVAVGASVAAAVEFTDVDGSGITHTATIDWGDGTTVAAAVTEPSASAAGRASASHVYTATGVYTLKVQVVDNSDSAIALFHYVTVIDPNGGFVTGGGTIDSPSGAWAADPALTGNATFGFTMKYLKNQAAPVGEADFHFQKASLKFKATTNDWFVVAGSKALFRVTGTINGGGVYGCAMTVVSGQPTGRDKLRIKIWDQQSGRVLYDNMRGAADDLTIDPPPISGGSIIVH